MRYPVQLLFRDTDGSSQASGERCKGGWWLIDWTTHSCLEWLTVDDFPDHWIEQLRRTVNKARRMK